MSEESIGQETPEIKDRLALAKEYLEMGFSIIPLRPSSKLPLIAWEEFKTRKATIEEVTRWFEGTHNNIAIVTGAISGVAVVDCDSMESLTLAQTKFPSHQRTRTTKGEHFWFKHPGTTVRNSVNLHGIKLDIRGDGGYVVAPGSLHPDGNIYQRSGVWGPVSQLPEFPQMILAVKDSMDDAIRASLEVMGPAIQGESGDAKTFQVACRLVRGFALTEEKALEFMLEWNEGCKPKWTKRELREKIHSALKSGSEPFGIYAEQATQEWRKDLRMDKAGKKLLKFVPNLDVIFKNDSRFRGTLTLNEMTRGIHWHGEPVRESFAHDIHAEFCKHWGAVFSRDDVVSAAVSCAHRNPFHPMKEMLYALPAWDRQERIRRILPEILMGEDTPLHQQMIRCFFVGAVRRVFQPGCKLDTALVLVGRQGAMKSTFFRIIGGPFFADTPIDTESKDRFMTIHRAWILELAELDGMTSAKASQHVKGLLSSSVDTFRPPYGKVTITAPRSCVMVGTCNTDEFLMDTTGSRRFWPIHVSDQIETTLLTSWRDQILAEALFYEANGEPHWLASDMDQEREVQNEQFTAHDPWEDLIHRALERVGENGGSLMDGVASRTILDSMDLPAVARTKGAEMRIAGLLKRMGWLRKQKWVGGLNKMSWVPPANLTPAPAPEPTPY